MSDSVERERGLVVRAGTPHDQPAVLSLNNTATPHVNALTDEQFAWIAGEADYYRVAERDGAIMGFVFAIRNGTSYWSGNYAWFAARYPAFIYLDRVVVAPDARKCGVGRALYDDLVKFASGRWPRITLEVNVEPPNPGSIAFHERMQFTRVGMRRYADGEVAMFERLLSGP
jgi:predicted GNAT superfamily acetyltransferase